MPPQIHRFLMILALGFLLNVGFLAEAMAQGRGFSPEQMAERQAAQLEETIDSLHVTGELEKQVRAILVAHGEKRTELMTAARESGSFGSMRETMAALDAETATKLDEILNDDQMARYNALMAARAARRGGGRRGGQ